MFPRLPFSLNFCYVIARSHTPRTKNSNQMLLKFVTLVSFSISVKKGQVILRLTPTSCSLKYFYKRLPPAPPKPQPKVSSLRIYSATPSLLDSPTKSEKGNNFLYLRFYTDSFDNGLRLLSCEHRWFLPAVL